MSETSQPAPPAAVPAGGSVPGKTLGIVGLIVSFFFSLVGLILCIIALVQSRKAGVSNIPAVVGIVIGALALIGTIIAIIALIGLAGMGVDAAQQCLDGATSVTVAGQEVLCSEVTSDY